MITFPSITENTLKLKPVALHRFCSICVKDAVDWAHCCPECLHPYDNNEALLEFDYEDYRHYSAVNLDKIQAFFFANVGFLKQCNFCGCDPQLRWKTLHLYDRYYDNQFHDSLNVEAFFLSCTGCTFATPFLYAYVFYSAYLQMIYAWHQGKSRVPLIKYVDLRLPDWSINNHILKRIKDYADDYRQHSQLSLF